MKGDEKRRLVARALDEYLKKRGGELDKQMRELRERSLPSEECAFCGKGKPEVLRLIAGPTVCICNECVQLCAKILKDEGLWTG